MMPLVKFSLNLILIIRNCVGSLVWDSGALHGHCGSCVWWPSHKEILINKITTLAFIALLNTDIYLLREGSQKKKLRNLRHMPNHT